jgi:hypothetical protein
MTIGLIFIAIGVATGIILFCNLARIIYRELLVASPKLPYQRQPNYFDDWQ